MFTPIEIIETQRRKVKEFIKDGVVFNDPMFKNYFIRIYDLTTELTTSWSCQGHPDNQKWNTPYIMFYCTEKGKVLIEKAFDDMLSKISVFELYHSRLSINIRVKPTASPKAEICKENAIKVLIWGCEHNFKNEENRERYIDTFLQSLITILEQNRSL